MSDIDQTNINSAQNGAPENCCCDGNCNCSAGNSGVSDQLQKVSELEDKLVHMESNWKRALADYKNFEKRMIEEKEQILNFASFEVVASIIPVLDNLEMLDAHLNDMGLKLTVKDFKQILTGLGLTEIETLGRNFDSTCMDAVESVDGEKNKVLEVVSKGYLLKGKLIRPSRVKVGKGN